MISTERTTSSSQSELIERFKTVRNLTLEICEPLQPEDFVVQPSEDVSPPKWHLAHTTWFFETFLLKDGIENYQLFDEDYPYLFNSYYETEGERWGRAARGVLSRPWVNEIMAYRNYVDEHLIQFLKENQLSPELLHVFEVGLNHEQQHQELLIYDIKHILGVNPLYPIYQSVAPLNYSPDLSHHWLRIKEGLYPIGYEGKGFHFDNEKGRHQVYLPTFEISDRLVTNGEFLEFVEAGGYQDFRYWLMEGFEWVKKEKIESPFYWEKEGAEWYHFTLSGREELPLDAPVSHISFYEADAYAKWKGLRLPTEFEWEVACGEYASEVHHAANLMDKRNYRPMPRQAGNLQFFGDCWEWTNSAYLPYPFYERKEGALGEYNGKFMVNQMVLRGGSYATMASHIRKTYRNFFHPHLRWNITGFRLARYI